MGGGNSKAIVLWMLGGVGIVLLYAAYKGKSPTSIFTGAFAKTGTPKPLSTKTTGTGTPTPQTGQQVAEINDPGANHTAAQVQVSGRITKLEDGTYWVTDADGNPVQEVAGPYQTTPRTYIPTGVN